MAALLRKSQRGLAVVGARVRVRSVRDKYFDNVETTVGNSLQQWRMSFGVTVVHVRAILREPFIACSAAETDRIPSGYAGLLMVVRFKGIE